MSRSVKEHKDKIFLIAVIAIFVYSRYKYLGLIPYCLDKEEYSLLTMLNIGRGAASLKLLRLVGVAGGLFGLVFSYLTVLEMTGKAKYAVLEAVLIITLPIFFVSERTGVPAYLFHEIVPAAVFLMIRAIRSNKRSLLFLSVLLWVLCFYLQIGASGGISPANIPINAVNIKALLWDDGHPFNVSAAFGTIYVFSVPVAAAGMIISARECIVSLKGRSFDPRYILWAFTLVTLIIGLISKNADTRTVNGLFFAVSLFICEGLIWLSKNLKGAYWVEIAIYMACFALFFYHYYISFDSKVYNSADFENRIVIDGDIVETL